MLKIFKEMTEKIHIEPSKEIPKEYWELNVGELNLEKLPNYFQKKKRMGTYKETAEGVSERPDV